MPRVASLEAIRDDLAVLNPYSVQLRYPGLDATQEEAKTAVQTMKRVRVNLRKQLKLNNA